MAVVWALHPLRADVWNVKVNLLSVHFVLQHRVCHPTVHPMHQISLGDPPPSVGWLFVNWLIGLMNLSFIESIIFSWSLMVVLAVVLFLNLLNCMRALALPLLWNALL